MSLRNSLPADSRTMFTRPPRVFSRRSGAILTVVLLSVLAAPGAKAQEAAPLPADEAAARRTAVALNYCRSAFHRIRQNPTDAVLDEERRKILNNLDLTAIHDEAIVQLYTSTLDEISDIRIADQERSVVDKGYGKSWKSLATVTMFGFLTDISEFNYASVVRRGATSWWDFRGIQVNHDMELWKVEKARLVTIQDKSTNFLEASWKLAHSRNVPDRWLVRNADFERLQQALQEPELKVRLRLLERMAPFMECYPPYWYYVGRTQQQLGMFKEAEHTYAKVAALGDGHFRRDEMLAAAMVNVASIRDYLNMPGDAEAAQQALAYTTDSWEVNLAAAAVLMRDGQIAKAEDAVLRNLDSELESEQSEVALLAVYSRGGDPAKILARLDDRALVHRTPIPILLRCAARLEGQTLPRPVAERLQSSLHAYVSRDDLVVVADSAWNLRDAMFAVDESSQIRPQMQVAERTVTVRLPQVASAAQTGEANGHVTVMLKYDADFTVKLALKPQPHPIRTETQARGWIHNLPFVAERRPVAARPGLEIASVETAGALIALNGPVRGVSTSSPASESDASLADVAPSNIQNWHDVQVQPAAYAPNPTGDDIPGKTLSPPVAATDSSSQGVTLGSPEPLLEALP